MDNVQSYNVLIVDGDETILTNIESIFDNHELVCNVQTAAFGQAALKRAELQQFDLVVIEVELPGSMSGKDLINEFKALPYEFRPKNIMIMSEDAEKAVLKKSGAGISVLRKPFEDALFAKYISAVLGNKTPPKKKKKKKAEAKVNVDYINPFIDATLEVLDIMAEVKAEKDFVFIREEDDVHGGISGIIPITSNKYVGSMAITFEENVYLSVISKMLGEDYTEINDENKDGIGELCNQIYGNAKAVLNTKGYELEPAFPTIVHGADHKVSHGISGNILAVYFKTEFGKFIIECIMKTRG